MKYVFLPIKIIFKIIFYIFKIFFKILGSFLGALISGMLSGNANTASNTTQKTSSTNSNNSPNHETTYYQVIGDRYHNWTTMASSTSAASGREMNIRLNEIKRQAQGINVRARCVGQSGTVYDIVN